jgi:hypothetical protein
MPIEANTASKAAVNLASRSPDQVGERVTGLLELADEVAREPSGPLARGCAVVPSRCARLGPGLDENATYRRRSVITQST